MKTFAQIILFTLFFSIVCYANYVAITEAPTGEAWENTDQHLPFEGQYFNPANVVEMDFDADYDEGYHVIYSDPDCEPSNQTIYLTAKAYWEVYDCIEEGNGLVGDLYEVEPNVFAIAWDE